jgi:hypothetical protein
MAPVFAALNHWKAKHKEPAEPPVLNLLESGGETVVFDTREHAPERIVLLDQLEAKVLKEFRRPSSLESVVERVSAPATEARRAVERMVNLAFVVRVGDKGVSVVCESGWRVHRSNPPYPGGMVAGDHVSVGAAPIGGVEWRA